MRSSAHTRSNAERIDPSPVPLVVSESVTFQYFSIALLTVLMYHSMITMDEEARYFWPNPWNSISLVYFANRYIGIYLSHLNGFKRSLVICRALGRFSRWTSGVSNMANIVLIDYILLIRVLALYNQNTILDIYLKVLLASEAVAGPTLLIYTTLFQGVAVGSLAEGITICGQHRIPPTSWGIISWAIPMVYGLILLVRALYKAAEYWKLSSGLKGFHLVAVLIQDQIVYYGFVILCYVLKIIDIRIIDINVFVADTINVAGSPTLLCVLGGQLLINLKEAGEKGVNGGTNYRSKSVSDIQFA